MSLNMYIFSSCESATPKRSLLLSALCALVIYGLSACAKPPTEQLLLKTIDQMQAAGEARDVGAFMDAVSDDFSGQNASMDRRAFAAYMMAIRMRTKNIGVTRTETVVTMGGDRASVEFGLLVTDGGKILPAQGQFVRAQTQWRYVSGGWQLASAAWTEGL
jgi:hypothetical protein